MKSYSLPSGLSRDNILYRNPLSNFYVSASDFFCKPVVKLIAADDAQGVLFWNTNIQALRLEIKMDVISGYVRDFVYIQAQAFEQNLSVEGQAASAKLEAWITLFFEDQDAGGKMRSDPL